MTRRRAIWAAVAVLIVAAVVLVLLVRRRSGPVGAAPGGVVVRQGELEMTARLDPDPPRQEGQRLVARVTKAGKPVTGGSLALRYDMPAMGAMPEMTGKATVESTGPGQYAAAFSLPMAGSWTLDASFSSPAGSLTATYSLTTGRKGLTLVSGGGGGTPGTTPAPAATVHLSPERRQLIGLKTARVERREAEHLIRTFARVTYDERRLTDVSLQVRGWVGTLSVDATGQPVAKGQELFTFYSPTVFAAEQDLIALGGAAAAGVAGAAAQRAARRRLALWQVSPAFIARIEKTRRAEEYVPMASPASGYVVEKKVVAGAAIEAGETLYRIADLGDVWLVAELYEQDVQLVQAGQAVTVTLTYDPTARYEAKIDYVYPYLQPETRTGSARIVVPNPDLALKPAMYASVELAIPRGERLLVPRPAVIYDGQRRLVFVDLGDGRLELRRIEIGLADGDWYEVVSGLREGDVVVISGNFLISSESRLGPAAEQW